MSHSCFCHVSVRFLPSIRGFCWWAVAPFCTDSCRSCHLLLASDLIQFSASMHYGSDFFFCVWWFQCKLCKSVRRLMCDFQWELKESIWVGTVPGHSYLMGIATYVLVPEAHCTNGAKCHLAKKWIAKEGTIMCKWCIILIVLFLFLNMAPQSNGSVHLYHY